MGDPYDQGVPPRRGTGHREKEARDEKTTFEHLHALALCLGLLPGTALAADDETVTYGTIEVGGKTLTNSTDTPTVYATTDATTGTVTTEGATAENYNSCGTAAR